MTPDEAADYCLGKLETSCEDLELTEEECDCPGQILVAGDCSSFYVCFSRTRVDCGGILFTIITYHLFLFHNSLIDYFFQRINMWMLNLIRHSTVMTMMTTMKCCSLVPTMILTSLASVALRWVAKDNAMQKLIP